MPDRPPRPVGGAVRALSVTHARRASGSSQVSVVDSATRSGAVSSTSPASWSTSTGSARCSTTQPSAAMKSATMRPPSACRSPGVQHTSAWPRSSPVPVERRGEPGEHRTRHRGGEVLLGDADLPALPAVADLVQRRAQHVEVEVLRRRAAPRRIVDQLPRRARVAGEDQRDVAHAQLLDRALDGRHARQPSPAHPRDSVSAVMAHRPVGSAGRTRPATGRPEACRW